MDCFFISQTYASTAPLKIGYYTDLPGAGKVSSTCARAVHLAKTYLEGKGHTVSYRYLYYFLYSAHTLLLRLTLCTTYICFAV